MRSHKLKKRDLLLAGSICLSGAAYAQNTENTLDALEEVIVTGVVQPVTKLESTASVTSLNAEEVLEFTPRSTAEIFRNIPGVQSESSSGDANANIKVRGLPISSGGARYLSLQEDGLPVLLIGDLEFITADSFLRFDYGIDSVQSIRGGTAGTQAANSPGGIINFISNDGSEEGGAFGFTTGLDYNSNRLDFQYGKPFGDGWQFSASGFIRDGEGPRDVPGNLEEGYQLKANITKSFENGFVRLWLKELDDRAPTYLPIPARYTGSGFEEVGVDFGDGTLTLQGPDTLIREGGLTTNRLNDGFKAEIRSIGFQGEIDVNDATSFAFNHRTTQNSGSFVSPSPAEVFTNANGPAVRIHNFNTQLDSLDNALTDLNITSDFGAVTLKAGVFRGYQEYVTQWGWNTYFVQLDGGLTPVAGPGGEPSFVPGHPLWGDCCNRSYDMEIENIAPYLALSGQVGDNLTWDASVRRDDWTYEGNFAFSGPADANGFLTFGPASPIDASFDYTSWSVGANYALSDSFAVFGNISDGGSAFAPSRVTGSLGADGDFNDPQQGYGQVEQKEIGIKYQGDNASLYVTYFDTETVEPGAFEVTTQRLLENSYESNGLEIEGDVDFGGGFFLKGSMTYTDAEISDSSDASVIGNRPRRQAKRIYNITPTYSTESFNLGLNFVGTSDAFVQDNNDLKFDGYVVTNLFATYFVSDQLSVSLNVNNLADEEGFTEGEEGSATAGDFVRIRPINGRTTSVSLRYNF